MDEYDIFGHLLEYQATEEFNASAIHQQQLETERKRPLMAKASRKYRADHSVLVQLRAEAARMKSDIIEQQGGLCFYCSAELQSSAEIDHTKPLIDFSDADIEHANDRSNLCVSCQSCNRRKGRKRIKGQQL